VKGGLDEHTAQVGVAEALYACIRAVPCSNLDHDNRYPDRVFEHLVKYKNII
jgi:hypothetical protein